MLEEILNPTPEAEKVETQPEEPQGEQQAEGAPTAPQNDSHVPLAALEAERAGRKDWKEKAIRYEEELKQLRQQQQQPTQPQPQLDPLQSMQQQIINERFNTSEMLVRNQHEDADEKVNLFMEAARSNPALAAALQQQRHPWQFAYNEGKRMLMLKEVGDDPAAYREKLKAELRAEMQQAQTPQPLNLPATLNGARSVAPRSSPGFSGPTPFDNIVNRQ